ncbi:MAG TPA: hypothetical protein EYN69_08885 [Flavobacteriales bacterium]|nr:hypothetical protein [Flavobacteriales bacterium]
MRVLLFCILFNLSQLSLVVAQVETREKKVLEQAEEHFYDGDFKAALPLYRSVYSSNPRDPLTNFALGVMYINLAPNITEDIKKVYAIPHLEFCRKEKYLVDVSYFLARVHHLTYQFEKAQFYYREYLDSLPMHALFYLMPIVSKEKQIRDVRRKIEMCNNGIVLIADTVLVEFANMGLKINSSFADYSSAISADNEVLIFTSRRPRESAEEKMTEDYSYYEDVYITYKKHGEWMEAMPISDNINTKKHDASIGLASDAQSLFTYFRGDIYMSRLEGMTWTVPKKLGKEINTSAWETHISINAAQNTIYFVSDRKGGYGGRDIYKAVLLATGEWGDVQNLGPMVNTVYDEEAPFIHPDDRHLYFSSKGHNSMGGFDIFYTVKTGDKWATPKNIGYPINTPGSDVFFTVSANGRSGYISTIREGGLGEKDIYVASMPDTGEVPLTVIRGMIKGDEGQPLAAKFAVKDVKTKELVGIYTSNSATGKYLLVFPPGHDYDLVVSAENFVPHREQILIPDQNRFYDLFQEIQLTSATGADAVTGRDTTLGQKIFVRNAFFDIDSAVSTVDEVLLQTDVKEIAYSAFLGKLENTEDRASISERLIKVEGIGNSIEAYAPTEQVHVTSPLLQSDLDLITVNYDTLYATSLTSDTRVDMSELTALGITVKENMFITAEQLDTTTIQPELYFSMKGYNEGLDEIAADTPGEGREDDSHISMADITDESKDLDEIAADTPGEGREDDSHISMADITVASKDLELQDKSTDSSTEAVKTEPLAKGEKLADDFVEDGKAELNKKKEMDLVGKRLILRSVQFEVEQSVPKPGSNEQLKKVASALKVFKYLQVEITGHTCSLGEESYNQQLSERRAKAVVRRLIKYGVDESRITYQGHGETQPITTNETLKGRRENRRSELVFVGVSIEMDLKELQ